MVPGRGSDPHGGHPPQDFQVLCVCLFRHPGMSILKIGAEDEVSNPRPPTLAGCILPLGYFRKDMFELFH